MNNIKNRVKGLLMVWLIALSACGGGGSDYVTVIDPPEPPPTTKTFSVALASVEITVSNGDRVEVETSAITNEALLYHGG